MGLFTPKYPKSDTPGAISKARKAEEARRANARIEAALASMERTSREIEQRRAELRAKCPLSNHDRCLSH
ncbi:hypothetical protein GCM10009535_12180 [Streptomyces thermocarboxydovorans]|jgi:hypothetical protein|uniref:Uncharacterized protein n=1 Tax=Streptomyces thermocarboxydovorans TaxID=59298 RepID=A0ABN1HBZ8_9ACTN